MRNRSEADFVKARIIAFRSQEDRHVLHIALMDRSATSRDLSQELGCLQENKCRHTWFDNVCRSMDSQEDFGNRKIPGKCARRHFSQLSEFESGLIIGMKAAGWSTRRVAGKVDRSECVVRNCWEQWTRESTQVRKTGSGETRKITRREDRSIVRQALVDPTVTRSTIRADVGIAIVPQTISRHLAELNLKSK
ncbi:uncharacterized protein TNCV_1724671 [Trichonephila clavipes]|nr:uncharacterized protein TNCV_1724671 [Trichonephila clavipes]